MTSGYKLRADKSINLPDSKLSLPALTEKDIENLRFVAQHAELVGMSFVRRVRDVYDLQSQIERLDGRHLGVSGVDTDAAQRAAEAGQGEPDVGV